MASSLERPLHQGRLPFEPEVVPGERAPATAGDDHVLRQSRDSGGPDRDRPAGGDGVAPDPADPGGRDLSPAVFVRNARARRYVLRVDADGTLRVTIPRGGSRREAETFLARHQAWVARQRAKLRSGSSPGRQAVRLGDRVLLRGVPVPVTLEIQDGAHLLRLGDVAVPVDLPLPADVGPLLRRALRAAAARELPARLAELAAAHALRPSRVLVRDQRSRWGSCAATGTISLNWRLLLMPPEVRDYVIIHELMHLREANHSRRFWRHVHRACPGHLAARRWLAREGRALL